MCAQCMGTSTVCRAWRSCPTTGRSCPHRATARCVFGRQAQGRWRTHQILYTHAAWAQRLGPRRGGFVGRAPVCQRLQRPVRPDMGCRYRRDTARTAGPRPCGRVRRIRAHSVVCGAPHTGPNVRATWRGGGGAWAVRRVWLARQDHPVMECAGREHCRAGGARQLGARPRFCAGRQAPRVGERRQDAACMGAKQCTVYQGGRGAYALCDVHCMGPEQGIPVRCARRRTGDACERRSDRLGRPLGQNLGAVEHVDLCGASRRWRPCRCRLPIQVG